MPRIFVSYRKAEENFAAQLLDDHLCGRFGPDNVFRASRAIRFGEDFSAAIWEAVRTCSVLLAVIDPDWVGRRPDGRRRIDEPRDYVRREVAAGLERDIVVPVLLAGASPPSELDLPEPLARLSRLQYLQLRARDSRYDLDPLLDQLAERLGVAAAPAPAPAPAGTHVEGGYFAGNVQVGRDLAGRDMFKGREPR